MTNRSKYLFALTVAAASTAHAGLISTTTSGLLNFESSNQLTNNFRIPYTDSNRTVGQTDPTAGEPDNDYVFNNATNTVNGTTGNPLIGIYDTTPSSTTDQNVFSTATPLTVRFDLRAAQAGSSFGVYFLNPTSETTANQLALVNIDANGTVGTDELFRSFSNGNISQTNNAGTQNGSSITSPSGVNAGSGLFSVLTVTYSVSGTTPTITMNLGSATASFTYAAGTAIASPEVAFRINESNTAFGTADLDNFIINPAKSISLTGSAGSPNVATGNQITVTGSNGNYISEIDDLTNPSIAKGSAPVVSIGNELTGTDYVMLWMDGDVSNIPGLDTNGGIVVTSGTEYNRLAVAYPGWDILISYANFSGSKNVNFDFTGSGYTVDKIAVVPEPAMFGLMGLGAAGMLAGRRRRRS